jgi:hypothetical protein
VTLLCVGLLAGYYGLIRRYGRALHPHPDDPPVSRKQVVSVHRRGRCVLARRRLADGGLSEYLFSAHMLQHLLQGFVIPPLLLLGIPRWMGEVLLQAPRVRRVVRRLSRPGLRWARLQRGAARIHSPQVVGLQLNNEVFHAFDHLLLIGPAFFMWMNLVQPGPAR